MYIAVYYIILHFSVARVITPQVLQTIFRLSVFFLRNALSSCVVVSQGAISFFLVFISHTRWLLFFAIIFSTINHSLSIDNLIKKYKCGLIHICSSKVFNIIVCEGLSLLPTLRVNRGNKLKGVEFINKRIWSTIKSTEISVHTFFFLKFISKSYFV